MLWVLLALAAAVTTTARDVAVKSAMRPGDEPAVAFLLFAAAALLLLPLAVFTGAVRVTPPFWPALVVSGSINAAAGFMIARAFHRSDISLVAPLQSTTPLFMIPIGWMLLDERPDLTGIGGITAIVAGAYLLGLAEARRSGPGAVPADPADPLPGGSAGPRPRLLAPLAALATDPGARIMIAVAALYAVSGAVDKLGVRGSTPLLWAGSLCAFAAAALALLNLRHFRRLGSVARRAGGRLVGGGVLMAMGLAAQMMALTLAPAAYVIATKRTSILFTVAAGGLLFRERGWPRRLAGAAVMLAGFLLLALAAD
jgi:drug/metabolite transporter (DMT)-like permease